MKKLFGHGKRYVLVEDMLYDPGEEYPDEAATYEDMNPEGEAAYAAEDEAYEEYPEEEAEYEAYEEYPEEEAEYEAYEEYPEEEAEYEAYEEYPEEEAEYEAHEEYPEEEPEYEAHEEYPEEPEYLEDEAEYPEGYEISEGYEEPYYEERLCGEDAEVNDEDEYYESDTAHGGNASELSAVGKGRSKDRLQGDRKSVSLLTRISAIVCGMNAVDKIMVGVSVIVLILALVTIMIFVNSRMAGSHVAAFADVGSQLEGIDTIGGQGLAAVADAEIARISAATATLEPTAEPEEPPKEYDEVDYKRQVEVEPDFTSIQKDLKIKFINTKTGKLVPNVPFSVTVTDPDGKSYIWSDDDMDGIIYKKDIMPGSYKVTMESLADTKYSGYTIAAATKTVEVKEEIVYKKVDVENEVKQETEVNAAKEDTKINETEVESVLQDTLPWVESKVIGSAYNEVEKGAIADPAALVLAKSFLRMSRTQSPEPSAATETAAPSGAEPTQSPGIEPSQSPGAEPTQSPGIEPSQSPGAEPTQSPGIEPGQSPGAEPTQSPGTDPTAEPTQSPGTDPTAEPTQSPAADPTAEPTQNPTAEPAQSPGPTLEPTVEPTQDPTATPSPSQPPVQTESPEPTADPDPDASVSPSADPSSSPSPTPTATPEPQKGKLTVDKTVLSGIIGAKLTAKASASEFTEGMDVVYSIRSSAPAVAQATIDADGTISVTGISAGTAVLTITANYEDGAAETEAEATISVAVGEGKTLVLDQTSATVYATLPVTVNAVLTNALAENPVVTAESSDPKIATVSVDKMAVTITGVAEGSAVITVKYDESGEEVSATCAVTVKRHPMDDKTTLLKTLDGQQVYVAEGTNYREAVHADYYTAEKFYVKGEVKYTGWQTLGGKVYYFTADCSKVTGEQVIQGAKYNFASDGSLVTGNGVLGIDVSKWNGTIDWNAVKNSGISYVIIRCGYRGSSTGKLIVDPKFEANIKGATAAGLKVGIYFFSQAVDEVEAVEEASMVLGQIKNYTISYPVFIDVEASGGRGDSIDKATRTAVCRAFCQTIQNAHYTAGIYSNKTWLEEKVDIQSLSAYKVWLAQYATAPTYTGRYDMWQYRANGSVSGISGNVDLNISYLGY